MLRDDGFTLVELLVALVIAAVSISIAAATFGSTTDSLERMVVNSRRFENDAAGFAWLADALLAVGPQGEDRSFTGGADSMRFRSTLWTPAGWPEPTDVQITVSDRRLRIATERETFVMSDSLVSVSFDYLTEHGAASPWLARFDGAATFPLAVRLRRELAGGHADTTIFPVGVGR